jgi:hypothetical protein
MYVVRSGGSRSNCQVRGARNNFRQKKLSHGYTCYGGVKVRFYVKVAWDRCHMVNEGIPPLRHPQSRIAVVEVIAFAHQNTVEGD